MDHDEAAALPEGGDTSSRSESPEPFNRLSLPFAVRLPLLTAVSGAAGMFLGLAHGSQEAGLRFRAEHAHRLPNSQVGWFLYHKSKNYHVMLGGIKEGIKMGTRIAVWAGIFAAMEEGVDRGRVAVVRSVRNVRGRALDDEMVARHRDFGSTMLAGLGTAGIFSAWNRFPVPTAVRLAKMGAKVGLGFGLVQDLMSWARGRKLGYVEFIKRNVFGVGGETEAGKAVAAVSG